MAVKEGGTWDSICYFSFLASKDDYLAMVVAHFVGRSLSAIDRR